jgi:hypothetical protein
MVDIFVSHLFFTFLEVDYFCREYWAEMLRISYVLAKPFVVKAARNSSRSAFASFGAKSEGR